MEFKDYYAALGVAPDADEQTIKQVYRRLARQYHPDVNPNDKQAEDRFKEVSEAYEVLGDAEKRRKYDAMRQQYQQWGQRGAGDFNWGQWQAQPGEGVYTRSVSPEDLEDLFGSASPFSDFFGSMFGQGGRERATRSARGSDLEARVEVTLEEAFHGTTRSLQVGDRRIEARIPPGVQSGSRVRLGGQGGAGAGSGTSGDLYLVVEVLPHDRFEREGDDLYIDVPIDIFTAAAGGQTPVQTLDGAVMLKIPPRTQAGKTFRLRGKGMPQLGKPDARGDLYPRAKLVLPEPLYDREIDTLRRLAQEREAR